MARQTGPRPAGEFIMQDKYLIKNGTVVDGSGAPAYHADVRVRGSRIVAIGPDIEPERRERVIDATGCFVTPGFIESHNHYDAPMWWMPTLDPMPGYGVTTSVNGNCGFAAAPVHEDPAVRQEMVDIFSFFEDIPEKPFKDLLPWDWKTWSEYKASMQRNVKIPVNYAAYVGHIAIRLAVMGMEAWDRAATPDEIAKMCDLLEDALAAGALGMSSNLLDHDKNDRPIPTRKADDAEFDALFAVIARHPGTSVQVIVDFFMRLDGLPNSERMSALAKKHGIRMQIAGGVPTLAFQAFAIEGAEALHARNKAEGNDVWPGFHVISPTTIVSFNSSLLFAQSNNYVWSEMIQAKGEPAKFAMLEDPEWRARARDSWEKTFEISPVKNAKDIHFLDSATGVGPVTGTLQDYMDVHGQTHPSDGLADWLLENGTDSTIKISDFANNEEALDKLLTDPQAIGNLCDSGAHGQMFCGVGDNVLFLTRYVRDRKQLTIEQGIEYLTGRIAGHFHMDDRGTLKVGQKADIVVFDLDEIERRPEEKAWDVPDGEGGRTYRYTRQAAPMRLTMVNGVPTFDRGAYTGAFPGEYIGPDAPALAEAAE
ncbi:amidohydrolase family protein [Novosphingobium sp.]|uniref:N-acyl-D-amino-acid deacylase family protein n=1 Tax=Novosphingobium sp. TaxID=1874826 RepID=UPI003340F67F